MKYEYTKHIQTHALGTDAYLYTLPTSVRGLTYCHIALPHGSHHAPGARVLADVLGEILPDASSKGQARATLRGTLRAAGAEVCVGVEEEYVSVHITAPSKQFESALRAVLQVVLHPTVPQKEFTEIRRRLEVAYIEMQDNTRYQAKRLLTRAWYGDTHPHTLPTPERCAEELAGTTAAQAREWYANTRTQRGFVAVCATDTAAKRIQNIFSDMLAGVQEHTMPPLVSVEDVLALHNAEAYTQHVPDKINIDTCIGVPLATTRDSEEYHALRAGVYVLGGSASGRLFQQLRNKNNYTYGSYAKLYGNTTPYPLYLMANAIFPNTVYEQALVVFQNTIHEWAEKGITAKELAEYKTEVLGKYVVALASTKHVAATVFAYVATGRALSEIDAFPETVEDISRAEVNSAIAEAVDVAKLTTAAAGTFLDMMVKR